MMPKPLPAPTQHAAPTSEPASYQSLLTNLRALIDQGRQNAMDAINKIRLDTYWQMGQRISAVRVQSASGGSPDPDPSLITKLAEDLQLDKALIYRLIQFYESWPTGVPAAESEIARTLSWSHHIALLAPYFRKVGA